MFTDTTHVYLSPHHDDICFSVGALVGRLGAGVLVNVYSISSYAEDGRSTSPDDRDAVSRIRDDEDRQFAHHRLLRLNLDQLDSPLRGRDPFDTTALDDDVARVRPVLGTVLRRGGSLAAEKPLLFCPAGIGAHRDHLIVRNCVLADHQWLRQAYRIVFYEELHYASVRSARQAGLRLFGDATKGLGYSIRYRFKVTQEKLLLVHHYKSQFEQLPANLSSFTPADGSGEPHEAVWSNAVIPEFDRANEFE